MSLDVLEEAQSWLAKSNSICEPRPEVTGVILSFSLACGGERRAWVTSREDIHQSSKLSEWEVLNTRPNRS
jgi:hypothetical protein